MEPTTEVQVLSNLPLEEQVEQTFQLELVKVIPDPAAAIAKLKEQYMGMTVTDKASFKKADEARKDVKNVRVIGEKICDEQRDRLEKEKKGWIKKKNDWTATVTEIEGYLQTQTNEWKEAEKKKEAEEAARIEAEKKRLDLRLAERQQDLAAYSVLYADNTYMLGDVRYSYDQLRQADDESYQNEILPAFKAVYDQHEEERRQQEIERQEAEEKQRQEAEELRQQQEAFKKEQAELKQQRYEIRIDRLNALGFEGQPTVNLMEISNSEYQAFYEDVAEEISRKKKQDEERKAQERIAEENLKMEQAKKKIINNRYDQLREMGMSFDAKIGAYVYEDVNVDNATEICLLTGEEWDSLIDEITPVIAERKAEAERKRQEEEEQKRIEQTKVAVRRERFALLQSVDYADNSLPEVPQIDLAEMTDLQWDTFYSNAKAAYDKKKHEEWLEQEKIKKIQQEEREKERQAELTEGERWRDWKDKLQKFAADMPAFTNKRYSKMKAIAQEKFAEIQQLRADKISNN